MPIQKTVFLCSTCEESYDTFQKALNCESQTDESQFNIGDIVTTVRGHYGWFDGDKSWVIDPTGGKKERDLLKKYGLKPDKFHGTRTLHFYYVITDIDRDPANKHKVRYHLHTRAILYSNKPKSGYTFNEGHIPIVLIKDPPKQIVKRSLQLIGKKAVELLG